MIETIIILGVCAAVFLVLEWPRVSNHKFWRATVTPLASIIGSGFLVIGPILDHAFGGWAPLAMFALCALAYLFGIAVRENIRYRNDETPDRKAVRMVETGANWALSLAYIVSVAYYLNLFGAFAVRMTPLDADVYARILTTIMFLVVLGVGCHPSLDMVASGGTDKDLRSIRIWEHQPATAAPPLSQPVPGVAPAPAQ